MLPWVQQSTYKYVLDLPGNVAEYRLSGTFGMQSVVIIVPHERCRPWIYPHLQSGHNCILLDSALKLSAAVDWCRANDATCKEIARRGRQL